MSNAADNHSYGQIMRPISANIHLEALRHNLEVVRQYAPNAKVMAVVKANGYGHGLLNVAHGLNASDGFAVLGLNEAIDLREAGFTQKILLLEGVFSSNELNIAAGFGISLVVHNIQQIEMLERALLVKAVAIFIKINTGMNRLGFTPQDFPQAIKRLSSCNNVKNIKLMTHFANADTNADVGEQGIEKPLALFKQATQGVEYPLSLANSATILRYQEAHGDWVRPGIMLYGATPVAYIPAVEFNLKPAMTLNSEIISVQTLEKGESVGYGYRFTAAQKTRVGIVACGYADGYPRHAGQSNEKQGAPIAVAGVMTQTLGRVSMDMLFVDLTPIPQANVGSSVELWGTQVPVDDVALACDTIGYELLCAVSQRVPLKVID